jgi:hypothetical protein
MVAIVRHTLGCPVLAAQTRSRWPLAAPALPSTPSPGPFSRLAGHTHTLQAWARQQQQPPPTTPSWVQANG